MTDPIPFRRGPDFPDNQLLLDAADMIELWADRVMRASPGDLLASEACHRANDLRHMAQRIKGSDT